MARRRGPSPGAIGRALLWRATWVAADRRLANGPGGEAPQGPPLSEREREVLEAVASGATNREIAESLFLSPHTVKEHTSSLYRKLSVRNRAEAVQKAQRLGLLS